MKSFTFSLLFFFILGSCSSPSGKKSQEHFVSETSQFIKAESKVLDSEDSILNKISYLCYARKFSQAEILIDSFYRKNKKKSGYWNQVANCAFYRRNYVEAELFFNKALDLNPQYAPAWNNLGLISLKRNMLTEAVKQFQKSIKFSPQLTVPRFNLSQIYNAWGLGVESMKVLSPIVNKESDNPYFQRNLAYTYLINKDYKSAVDAFSRVSKKNLQEEGWRVFYPKALLKLGERKKAKSWLDSLTISTRNKDFLEYNRMMKTLESGGSNG